MLLGETYETLRYATVYMQVHAQQIVQVYYRVVVKKDIRTLSIPNLVILV